MLLDIAALTGATAIMKDTGMELEQVTAQHLGSRQEADGHQRGHHHRRRQGPARRRSKVASTQIRSEIENTTSDYDREKLQERLAKLTGGVAQINVGRSDRQPR